MFRRSERKFVAELSHRPRLPALPNRSACATCCCPSLDTVRVNGHVGIFDAAPLRNNAVALAVLLCALEPKVRYPRGKIFSQRCVVDFAPISLALACYKSVVLVLRLVSERC